MFNQKWENFTEKGKMYTIIKWQVFENKLENENFHEKYKFIFFFCSNFVINDRILDQKSR